MASELNIDFRQMPWSQTPVAWRYFGSRVWETLNASVVGDEGSVVVRCPASANPYMAGVLEVDAAGYRASISISAVVDAIQPGAISAVNEGRLAAFQHALRIVISEVSESGAVLEAKAVHPENPDARLSAMIDGLWDLQLAAVTVLEEIFGVAQSPPSVTRRHSVLQSLANV